MAASTAKRVILYRFDRQPIEGLVDPSAYLLESGAEWISVAGSLQTTPFRELKAICFVSEPGRHDLFTESTAFERRPKISGLWTRFYFRDGDQLDGVLPHNLLEWPTAGFVCVPPKSGAARGRVFVPRLALMATEMRGVVGLSGAGQHARAAKAGEDGRQLTIFD